MRTIRITKMLGVAGLATALALAGCGDDDDAGAGTTTTTDTSGGSTTTTTSGGGSTTTTAGGGIDPFEDGSTDPVTADATASGIALLTDVAIGRHEGFDRVVFTFQGDGLPEYRIEYVEPPIIADGSGDEVAVDGDFYIQAVMHGASGFDSETGQVTYDGPTSIPGTSGGASQIQEVVRTGDFEAVLTWVIGLADRVNLRVLTLSSPPRLVIDVQNH